jgi:hypothetical protein
MNRLAQRRIAGSLLLAPLFLGCGGQNPDDMADTGGSSSDPSASPSAGSAVDDSANSNGPSSADIPLANVNQDLPCGDDTVAVLKSDAGSQVVFCAHDQGAMSVGEISMTGREILRDIGYEPRNTAPADLYRMLAPGRAVPERLLAVSDPASPPSKQGRAVEYIEIADPILPSMDGLGQPVKPLNHNYDHFCGPNGRTNFKNERCGYVSNVWCQGNCEAEWCIDIFWGWHDRSMTGTIGEEGDYGREWVAACNGNVRFRAFFRWDVGDAWATKVDVIINPGGLVSWSSSCIDASEDCDVRFRSESADGVGVHRHTGHFSDY